MSECDWTCPIARAARLLGDTASLLILRDLEAGPRRFGELLGSAAGNTRLLSGRLRRLVAAGVVERCVAPGPPGRVTYCLSPMGADLLPALAALRDFGEAWLPALSDPLAPPAAEPLPGPHASL
jgi:DNA-binding HxlR family transcriptional regulator